MRYRLTRQAESDLEAILLEGILQFGEIQAQKYQESFKRTFELLAYMPEIGRKNENRNEHRFLHSAHVIYYRIEPSEIVITKLIKGVMIRNLWEE